jgi:hypothetical protein
MCNAPTGMYATSRQVSEWMKMDRYLDASSSPIDLCSGKMVQREDLSSASEITCSAPITFALGGRYLDHVT